MNEIIETPLLVGPDGTPVQSEQAQEPAAESKAPDLVPDEKVAGFVNQVTREMFSKLVKKLRKSSGQADVRFLMYYIGSVMRAYTEGIEQDIAAAESVEGKLELYKYFVKGFIREDDA